MNSNIEKDLEFLADLHAHTYYERTDTESKKVILNAYAYLKNRLTPPTAKEVCEALSEHYGHKFYYQKDKFKDGFHNGNIFVVTFENSEIKLTTTYFNAKLPPHLITLIGRFYEGLINND